MSRRMERGTCTGCGRERGIYSRTLTLCRACNDADTERRARRPNGPLAAPGADTPRPVCECGRGAVPGLEGQCLRCYQRDRYQPPPGRVYAEWHDWGKP